MAILSRFVVSKGSHVWTARGAVLLSLLSLTILSGMQQTHLVISNARARVLAVDLTDKAEYRLVTGKGHSSVWISVTDGIRLQRCAGGVVTTTAGDAHEEKPGESVVFHGGRVTGRLIIVDVQALTHPLTISSRNLAAASEEDDASGRNQTLLVAVSRIKLRDTTNRGDESVWNPGAARAISLGPGKVAWLSPGIHHLANLSDKPCQFVTIEW